jgi:hypothetical protein
MKEMKGWRGIIIIGDILSVFCTEEMRSNKSKYRNYSHMKKLVLESLQ